MGFEEISKNNPLKVIHSQLKYYENKEKISFIGIPIWPLDSSKMNRGIYLSITEPEEEDLIFTALKIAESYDVKLVHFWKISKKFIKRIFPIHRFKNQLRT